MAHYKKADIIAACAGSGGVITRVTEKLGAARQDWYAWIKKWPELLTIMEEEHRGVTVMAENVVMRAIENGDEQMAWKWLTRRDNRFKDAVKVEHSVDTSKKAAIEEADLSDPVSREALRTIAALMTGGEHGSKDDSPTKPD